MPLAVSCGVAFTTTAYGKRGKIETFSAGVRAHSGSRRNRPAGDGVGGMWEMATPKRNQEGRWVFINMRTDESGKGPQ